MKNFNKRTSNIIDFNTEDVEKLNFNLEDNPQIKILLENLQNDVLNKLNNKIKYLKDIQAIDDGFYDVLPCMFQEDISIYNDNKQHFDLNIIKKNKRKCGTLSNVYQRKPPENRIRDKIPLIKKKLIINLYKKGKSYTAISLGTGVKYKSVNNIICKH